MLLLSAPRALAAHDPDLRLQHSAPNAMGLDIAFVIDVTGADGHLVAYACSPASAVGSAMGKL
jgi:hypothetical protein